MKKALPPSPPSPLPLRGRGAIGRRHCGLGRARGERGMTVREAASRTSRKVIVAAARDLRRRQTESEQLLWKALRDRKELGRKFRRQARVGHFVVDFYCPVEQLVIEVDGDIHRARRTRDRDRQRMLESAALRVLRVTAEACERNLDDMLEQIRGEFRASPPSPPPPLPLRGRGVTGRSR